MRSKLVPRSVILTLVAAPLGFSPCFATCPVNFITTSCCSFSSTAPIDGCSYLCPSGSAGASYDLTQGRVSAGAAASPEEHKDAEVLAADDYQIVGALAGSPLEFVAELHVTGSTNATYRCVDGYLAGFLKENDLNSASAIAVTPNCSNAFIDTVLRVPLQKNGGEVFRLTFDVNTSISGGSSGVQGYLMFDGLPPGTGVTSCQGYTQEFPVPARQTTWGAIRALYH